MVDVLELQRRACADAGSELYGRILAAMADDVRAGGPCGEILAPWADNAMADAVPLRFLAAVHALVLDGRAPDLARWYPSVGGSERSDPVPAFLGAVREHRGAIESAMELGVQTNEVGRSAALLGGFHRIAAQSGLPLRLREIGASAGLLLRFDRYRYEARGRFGRRVDWGMDEGLAFHEPWTGSPPSLVAGLRVTDRRGCDVAPIDVADDAGVTRLRSFLWPDQLERRARLDAAIEIARLHPVTIDRADAGDWVAEQVAEPVEGVATVVYHAIVLQYLPRASFDRLRTALTDAGRQATRTAPLHWLRMEPAGDVADVRLRSWTGGQPTEELLATTGYHGPPVSWLEPSGPSAPPATG